MRSSRIQKISRTSDEMKSNPWNSLILDLFIRVFTLDPLLVEPLQACMVKPSTVAILMAVIRINSSLLKVCILLLYVWNLFNKYYHYRQLQGRIRGILCGSVLFQSTRHCSSGLLWRILPAFQLAELISRSVRLSCVPIFEVHYCCCTSHS